MKVRSVALRIALALAFLVVPAVVASLLAEPAALRVFTSLEEPPSSAEIDAARADGVTLFEFDLDHDGAHAAAAKVRSAGGTVVAYHVGGGGGRAWGSVRANEQVRTFDTREALAELTGDVRRLVALGAAHIHFDNTHRFSGKRLEAIADAIRAGGAGFVAKNNPEKWRLVRKRRPDLVPVYAVVEEAMFEAGVTQAAYDLHVSGVPVIVVGFRKPLDGASPPVTDDYAAAYKAANPWATVVLMADEQRYETRGARYF